MIYRFVVNLKGKPRKDTLEGRPHLVVPCTMLVEGVIEGSEGAWFYSNEENAKSAPRWDHMPIVVDHPRGDGGKFTSARKKTWIDSRKVGILLNSGHTDGKLKTECWFDVERTKAVDRRVYKAIVNGKQMEVSTGLDATGVEKPGVFDGKKYKGYVKDYQPDHLAVLPDAVGACSIKMGGGLFANVSTEPESAQTVLNRSITENLKSLAVEWINNELSFSDISRQLASILGAKFGEKGQYWQGYIRDVYPDYVVFSDGSGKLYQIGYTVSDTDGVALSGSAEQVVASIVYTTVSGKKYLGNEGELTPVPPEETDVAFDKNQHLATLRNGGYTEAEVAEFGKLPDLVLQTIKPLNAAPPPAVPPAPPPTPTPAPVVGPSSLTREQVMAMLPPEFLAVHNQGVKAMNQVRKTYVDRITKDPNNKFTEVQLQNMDLDILAATAQMARDPAETPAESGQFLNGWTPNHGGFAAPVYDAATSQVGLANAGAEPPEAKQGKVWKRPSLFANKEQPEEGKKTA